MTNAPRRLLFLGTSVVVLLALPACSTREIGANPATVVDWMPGPDRSGLLITLTPREETFEEAQAGGTDATFFYVFVDGSQLATRDSDSIRPLVAYEGATVGMGQIAAGSHHFEIKAAGGGPTLFAGDAELPPASETNLFLFGPAGAVQGRFVPYPSTLPPGTIHVSLVNLVRRGPGIELVSCLDVGQCVPASAPLALGEVLVAEFPGEAFADGRTPGYTLAAGGWLGFRQVPSAALPDPPVQMIRLSGAQYPDLQAPAPPLSGNLLAAPIFMSPEGFTQVWFN
jgi:hypothetical protein